MHGGAFDSGIEHGVETCLEAGSTMLLDHYIDRLDWDVFFGTHERSTLDRVLRGDDPEEMQPALDALVAEAMRKIVAAGQGERLFTLRAGAFDLEAEGQDYRGIDLLSTAAQRGCVQVLKEFIKGGVDLGASVPNVVCTPLQMMEISSHPEVVSLAKSWGARDDALRILDGSTKPAPHPT